MYSTGSSLLIPRFANHKRPVSAEGTLESPDPEAQAKWPSDQPGLHSSMLWVWVLSWRHSSCPGHGGSVINKRHLARSSSSAAPPVQLPSAVLVPMHFFVSILFLNLFIYQFQFPLPSVLSPSSPSLYPTYIHSLERLRPPIRG